MSNKQNYQQEIGPTFLAISATSLLMTAYKTYKDYLSKAARACDTMTGRDKSLCMTKYKMEGIRNYIQQLQKSLTKCEEAKYPEKCREKIKERIQKLEEKHKKLNERFKMLYNLIKQAEKERKEI